VTEGAQTAERTHESEDRAAEKPVELNGRSIMRNQHSNGRPPKKIPRKILRLGLPFLSHSGSLLAAERHWCEQRMLATRGGTGKGADRVNDRHANKSEQIVISGWSLAAIPGPAEGSRAARGKVNKQTLQQSWRRENRNAGTVG
jgi:hypothetical protein